MQRPNCIADLDWIESVSYFQLTKAGMAELADAADSKSAGT